RQTLALEGRGDRWLMFRFAVQEKEPAAPRTRDLATDRASGESQLIEPVDAFVADAADQLLLPLPTSMEDLPHAVQFAGVQPLEQLTRVGLDAVQVLQGLSFIALGRLALP